MLLRASSAFSLSKSKSVNHLSSSATSSSFLSSSSLSFSHKRSGGDGFVISALNDSNSRPITGVVFEPCEEVKKELQLVPDLPQQSLARHKFLDDSEAAINEQIK